MFLDPNSAERLLVCRNAGEAQAYLDKYCMNPATAAWIVAASNLPPTVRPSSKGTHGHLRAGGWAGGQGGGVGMYFKYRTMLLDT